MTHLAIPDGEHSPAEAELVPILNRCTALIDGFASCDLVLVAKDSTFGITLITVITGLDIDRWWAQ
jgi:hypothetical protein